MVRSAQGQRRGRPASVGVLASKIHGEGVFATRAIRRGDVVLEIDDSDPVLDRTVLTARQEIFIDVFIAADGSQKTTWMKSPERFINHSCEPSSYVLTDMQTGKRATRALKSLRKGEELTWDYAVNIWEEWVAPVPCRCGAPSCRGIIQGNFFTLPLEVQKRYLPLLDAPFRIRFARKLASLGLSDGHSTA